VIAIVVDKLVFDHTLNATQLAGGVLILFAAAGNNLGWGEKTPRLRG
jgi:drug/metabolite transporter (DMT)-like permease